MRGTKRDPDPPDARLTGTKADDPFLYTIHLVLRPLELEDAWEMRQLFADPELRRCCCRDHEPSLEDVRGLVGRLIRHNRRRGSGLWAICEKRTCAVLGFCGLFPFENGESEAELTYQLMLPPWCKGRLEEAVGACLRHGLQTLSLERVVAVADPDNPVSARTLGMLEKCGMRYLETRRIRGREVFVYEATRQGDR